MKLNNEIKPTMKIKRKEILFLLIIILMILFHFYTIKALKEDEQNLIDAFRSGQFDEYQRQIQYRLMNEN